MLPKVYRFIIRNRAGVTLPAGSVTITGARKKAGTYESEVVTLLSLDAELENNEDKAGPSQSNDGAFWEGIDGHLQVQVPEGADGSIEVAIQGSPTGLWAERGFARSLFTLYCGGQATRTREFEV